jgi:hypothetical protein
VAWFISQWKRKKREHRNQCRKTTMHNKVIKWTIDIFTTWISKRVGDTNTPCPFLFEIFRTTIDKSTNPDSGLYALI